MVSQLNLESCRLKSPISICASVRFSREPIPTVFLMCPATDFLSYPKCIQRVKNHMDPCHLNLEPSIITSQFANQPRRATIIHPRHFRETGFKQYLLTPPASSTSSKSSTMSRQYSILLDRSLCLINTPQAILVPT